MQTIKICNKLEYWQTPETLLLDVSKWNVLLDLFEALSGTRYFPL